MSSKLQKYQWTRIVGNDPAWLYGEASDILVGEFFETSEAPPPPPDPPPASGPPVFISATSTEASANWQTEWTFSHTISAGDNRLLVVTFQRFQGEVDVTSVTFNGVGLTKLLDTGEDSYYYGSYIYYMVAPPVGTYDVVVTVNGAVEGAVSGALSFTGVHQSSPFGNTNHGAGASSPGELSIVSASDQLVVSSMGVGDGLLTDADGQDSRYNVYCDVSNTRGASSTKVGAASTTVSYTQTSAWCMVIAAIMPAAGATVRRRIFIT